MSILNWIEDKKRLKILAAPRHVDKSADSSKGLWTRCDKCGVILYIKHLKENQRVCFGCSYHLQMMSQERIENLLDKMPATSSLSRKKGGVGRSKSEGSSLRPVGARSSSRETMVSTWRPLDETVSPCDPLNFHDQRDYTDRLADAQEKTGLQDAIQTGTGMIDGIPVALAVMDFSFMGGSMGSVVGEKITRLIEYATQEGLTLLIVSASGGARMQEGVFSLMQMAKISSALQIYQSCARLLYISILTSPTTGGVTASFAMLGDIIFAEPKALIAFAGRRVIEQTLCEELPDDFQTSEYMLHHGLVDLIVPRRFLRQALSESIRLYQSAPFKKRGQIPFGVQNPITFLTEERVRRQWGALTKQGTKLFHSGELSPKVVQNSRVQGETTPPDKRKMSGSTALLTPNFAPQDRAGGKNRDSFAFIEGAGTNLPEVRTVYREILTSFEIMLNLFVSGTSKKQEQSDENNALLARKPSKDVQGLVLPARQDLLEIGDPYDRADEKSFLIGFASQNLNRAVLVSRFSNRDYLISRGCKKNQPLHLVLGDNLALQGPGVRTHGYNPSTNTNAQKGVYGKLGKELYYNRLHDNSLNLTNKNGNIPISELIKKNEKGFPVTSPREIKSKVWQGGLTKQSLVRGGAKPSSVKRYAQAKAPHKPCKRTTPFSKHVWEAFANKRFICAVFASRQRFVRPLETVFSKQDLKFAPSLKNKGFKNPLTKQGLVSSKSYAPSKSKICTANRSCNNSQPAQWSQWRQWAQWPKRGGVARNTQPGTANSYKASLCQKGTHRSEISKGAGGCKIKKKLNEQLFTTPAAKTGCSASAVVAKQQQPVAKGFESRASLYKKISSSKKLTDLLKKIEKRCSVLGSPAPAKKALSRLFSTALPPYIRLKQSFVREAALGFGLFCNLVPSLQDHLKGGYKTELCPAFAKGLQNKTLSRKPTLDSLVLPKGAPFTDQGVVRQNNGFDAGFAAKDFEISKADLLHSFRFFSEGRHVVKNNLLGHTKGEGLAWQGLDGAINRSAIGLTHTAYLRQRALSFLQEDNARGGDNVAEQDQGQASNLGDLFCKTRTPVIPTTPNGSHGSNGSMPVTAGLARIAPTSPTASWGTSRNQRVVRGPRGVVLLSTPAFVGWRSSALHPENESSMPSSFTPTFSTESSNGSTANQSSYKSSIYTYACQQGKKDLAARKACKAPRTKNLSPKNGLLLDLTARENDIDFLNQAIELAATESVEWRAFYIHQQLSENMGFLEDFLQQDASSRIKTGNVLFYRSICRSKKALDG